MSIIQTGSFSKDLLPLVINTWAGAYPDWVSLYDKIFEVTTPSNRNFEEDALWSTFGLPVVKPEGSGVRFDSSKQLYNPRYVHTNYGLGFIITEEMLDDGNAFKNAKKFTEQLKLSIMRGREIIGHDIINRITTSGFTMEGGDGVVLGSASHPTTTGNVSNLIGTAADLSEAFLEQAAIDIQNLRDDRGNRIHLRPRKIVTNIAQEFELKRLLGTEKQPGTMNNDLNAVRSLDTYPDGYLVTPYMTDTDAVLILTNCPDGLKYMERKAMAIKSDNDFDTDNAKFKAQARYSFGWTDFRQVFYSGGA